MKFNTIVAAAAFAAIVSLTIGCASSGAGKSDRKSDVQTEYAKWASKRAPVEKVVSKSSDAQIATIINGIAVIPGEVYGYLANGADNAMARNAGRPIYEAIMRDMNAGTPIEEIRKALSAEDLAAAVAYKQFLEKQDYTSLGRKLADIAAKLAADTAKVAGALDQIKNLDSMKGKNPIALATALKAPMSEINTIKAQLEDAIKACSYWRDLNKQDEQNKKYAQEFPIEK